VAHEGTRREKQSMLDQQDQTIKAQMSSGAEKDARIAQLLNELRRAEDIAAQFDETHAHREELFNQKRELQDNHESALKYIQDLEDQYYAVKKEQLNLLKMLTASERSCEEMQSEIEVLRNYIIDLKSRIAVYIPVKDDKIDKKIAEYINNYPDRQKLKIMFMRESEGVYQFGGKRVMVKIDKDRINIRVGGGYLSIDEFLDQYTPVELEKLERKDPMKKFQEKVATTKALQGHEIVRSASPDSPVMAKQRSSPTKRRAI